MLKAEIDNSGLTRAEWAQRLSISTSFLSLLVNGKRPPSLELACRIEQLSEGRVPAGSWYLGDAARSAVSQSASSRESEKTGASGKDAA